MKRFIIILLSALLLCSCSTDKMTHPSENTVSAPPETDITAIELQNLSEFQDLLTYHEDTNNWIPFALGCVFENPQEIDLEFMFYLGTDRLGWQDISDKSAEELVNEGFMRDMDLQVMPVISLETALQSTFGISLSDATIPPYWYYLSAEDAYCSNNNDAYFIGPIAVVSATEYSNGITEVHYQVDAYYNTKTGEFFDQTSLVLTLKRHNNGYLVHSNLIESVG